MKRTFLIILFFCFLSSYSKAQDQKDTTSAIPHHKITYQEWKEQAESDTGLLPKFGSIGKDQEQKYIYKLKNNIRLKGSESLVESGISSLYRGDPKTAMERFNRAWRVDPKNENVFWGFASVYISFEDFDNAIKQLNEGLELNPKSSNILTDKAAIYVVLFQTSNDQKELSAAIDLFIQSYAVDPKNQKTLYWFSLAYFLKNDCDNALKYFNECKALGGKPLTNEYIQAIEKGCGNK